MRVRDTVASSGERTRLACWFRHRAETILFSAAPLERIDDLRKVYDRGTRSPARETRALPRLCERARSYSPSRWRNCARAYSRLSFAIKLALIFAGHTASHS